MVKKVSTRVSLLERNVVSIFGSRVDSTRKRLVLNWLFARLEAKETLSLVVVTPNPEILLRASRDYVLADIINGADLSIPDGVGVVAAMKYLSVSVDSRSLLTPFVLFFQGLWVGFALFFARNRLFELSEVVPGRVIFAELLERARRRGLKVFLLGGRPGVAEVVALKFSVKALNSEFRIMAESGPWLDEGGKPVDRTQAEIEQEVIKKIKNFGPDLLFVAFGPPKQEKWLVRNRPKLRFKIGMVVGGAFDYEAGRVPEPPGFLVERGMEWLWRLITQPWRVLRILDAVVVFPWRVFKWRLNELKQGGGE